MREVGATWGEEAVRWMVRGERFRERGRGREREVER